MLKTRHFLEKSCKNRRSVGGSAPKFPLASGGWGATPDPVLLFPYSVATFYERLVLMLTRFIIVINEQMRNLSDF